MRKERIINKITRITLKVFGVGAALFIFEALENNRAIASISQREVHPVAAKNGSREDH